MTELEPGAVAAQPRDSTIDVARGLAMVMVVLGHAIIGVVSAGTEWASLRFILTLMYTTHMALFFLISGILSGSYVRKPWPLALRALLLRMVWPYLLWSFVLLTTHYVMSEYTNTRLTGYNPISILWSPPAIMWFLYWLIIAIIVAKFLARLGRVSCLVAAFTCMALSYGWHAGQEIRFVGIVLVGSLIGRQDYQRYLAPKFVVPSLLVMAITAWIAWSDAIAWVVDPDESYPAFSLPYLPALFAGPIVLACVSRLICAHADKAKAVLDMIGRHTMAIFVTHILITAGTRIVLYRAGMHDPLVAIATAATLGIALPLAAQRVADRLKISALIGWR